MYGFDKNDESIFSRFKKEGIDAVVWVKNDEAMKKAEDTGLSYYILEAVQIALHTYFELDKSINRYEHILSQMTLDCPQGVLAGRELFKKGVLQKLAEEQGSAEEAYGTIWSQLKKIIS
jgi:hypothetical protein